MYNLIGGPNKEKIFLYIVKNPNKTAKEISQETKISYKLTYKILQELIVREVLKKEENSYIVSPKFIEYFKNLSNMMVKNNTSSLVFKNKLDYHNTLQVLYPNEKIKDDIDSLIDNNVKKLDDWYCKFYDLENKEYQRIKTIIENNF